MKTVFPSWQPFWQTHKINLLAFLLFLVLTIIPARNILLNLDEVIIGRDFDTYINLWADWWTAKALSDSELDLWQTDYLTYPQESSLTYHSFSHLNTAVSLLLQTFLDPLPAFNLAILMNYILTGLAMFQLVRYVTGSTSAALLAGIVFAFNTHNLYQSAHPVLVSVWCFPWATRYFLQAMQTKKTRYILIAALFVILGTLTSLVLTFILALWFAFLWLVCFFVPNWPRPSYRLTIIFAIVCIIPAVAIVLPQLSEAVGSGNSSFIIDARTVIPLDLAAIFVPPWFVWFSWTIYIGIVSFSLIILARRRGWAAFPWYLLLIGSWLLAIGPYPNFLQQPVDLFLPWTVPLIPFLRNPYRLSILIAFAMAFLVGYGWLVLSERINNPRTYKIAFLVVALLIYADYTITSFPQTRLEISPFFTDYLDTVSDNVALAMLPTGRLPGKVYMYYQSIHQHKMSGGVISRPTEDSYAFMYNQPLLRAGEQDLPPVPVPGDITRQLAELSAVDIGYLVLNKTYMLPEEQEAWRLALPLTPVFEDEWVVAYHTEPQMGRDFAVQQTLTDYIAWNSSSWQRQEDGTWLLTLGWLALQPPPIDVEYEIMVLDNQNRPLDPIRRPLTADFPTSQWQRHEIVVTQDSFTTGESRQVQVTLYEQGRNTPLAEPVLVPFK